MNEDSEETGRWLDQWLGDVALPASRDELLKSMRDHVLGDVIVATELPGTELPVTQAMGVLVEASRDPDEWGETAVFQVVSGEEAQVWHNADDFIKACGLKVPGSGTGRCHTGVHIPAECEVLAYPGVDAGTSGYRIELSGAVTLAIVLWAGVMHAEPSGDLAPGIGAFTAQVDEDDGES